MPTLNALEKLQRGKELEPTRRLAFKIWQENPNIHSAVLKKKLNWLGHDVAKGTCSTWVLRWNKGKGYARVTKPKRVVRIVRPRIRKKPEKPITWEQIVKACPDIEQLGLIVVNGLFKELSDQKEENRSLRTQHLNDSEEIETLNQNLEELREDRKQVMAQLNHYILKERERNKSGLNLGDIQELVT